MSSTFFRPGSVDVLVESMQIIADVTIDVLKIGGTKYTISILPYTWNDRRKR